MKWLFAKQLNLNKVKIYTSFIRRRMAAPSSFTKEEGKV